MSDNKLDENVNTNDGLSVNDNINENEVDELELLQLDDSDFMTESRTYKKPYQIHTLKDGSRVVIYDPKKVKPVDKFEIQVLVNNGCILKRKQTGITKADMINYVRKNYDKDELKLLENQLNSINGKDERNSKITFITIRNWFKDRYKYYPKGLNYNFGKKEKNEQFAEVFKKHKEDLKKSIDDKEPSENPKKGKQNPKK